MPAESGDARGERLQKALAHAGVASRRKCEEMILQGCVRVNGQVVRELGTRVCPGIDRIEVSGKPILLGQNRLYYVLYKPVGYLSTVKDPHGRPIALDLVPSQARLYPVGRLDMDSEGLLLLTNDGEMTQRLLHPRYRHEREYLVLLRRRIADRDMKSFRRGISLDGEARLARADISRLRPGSRLGPGSRPNPGRRWRGEAIPRGWQWVRVILREGRKRQIRRMFQAVGYRVERLVRVRLGILRLGDLEPGQGRWLSHQEIIALRRHVGLGARPKSIL